MSAHVSARQGTGHDACMVGGPSRATGSYRRRDFDAAPFAGFLRLFDAEGAFPRLD